MKKILNNPADYVDEMLEGMVAAHPETYAQPVRRVIARTAGAKKGKVGIVTGGGSGHLPIFTGYVGTGLLDACAIGDVFASPSAEQMAEAIRLADGGAGVLRLYGNYGGDVMNFDMAGEMAEMEHDIRTTTVLLTDDVVSAPKEEAEKRRGVAGMVYAFKIAGAAAERGDDLDEVTRIARKTADACRSIGMALTPCTIPQAGKPTFEIGETEMEMGMGIHGEPGIWRDAIKPADEIAEEMLERLMADQPLAKSDRISILVNSLGATPAEELYILYRHAKQKLDALGVEIVMPLVGRYATSMEMTGATITVIKLDEELETLLKAPAECAFWRV
ncbi:dihydroxyacetone kinase subunit DhaK [Nitratireductor aquimarinus]|uniref:dihydroxyacetone kinase subunit DhaK n=1 Tax=Nitratireductor TaxID=245876 RepID=UPI0019D3891F|nr:MULTISPECIES: dihydroxyacetone kinase subunit DhaK [Nitratireductor]MBN7775140.1 dihydroxyacetone kinase subunit DhaK [Nitratireductor pacificus]MBN7781154.1 dihydroxyacetone kinase subunit DhaK [Nitratireductor pacificus]MBN7789960.1 dihydroxyacetone kinase subunit DhaK [Nitratireductor aquimarinus]MBY6097527.1 dihydroxyacetone kinase subunit DhaK [Nitratireductor aquimarinus]MCA1260489.1 dihydroxyacetone kinase subunit DhaK [Nitratireductor aquimarinus]